MKPSTYKYAAVGRDVGKGVINAVDATIVELARSIPVVDPGIRPVGSIEVGEVAGLA